jgi:hypothetical protein
METLLNYLQVITYEIQVFHNGEWNDDASLLGHGLPQEANRWGSQEQAEEAMKELILLWPELDGKIRVCLA